MNVFTFGSLSKDPDSQKIYFCKDSILQISAWTKYLRHNVGQPVRTEVIYIFHWKHVLFWATIRLKNETKVNIKNYKKNVIHKTTVK